MKRLTISRARAVGKDLGAKGCVIVAFADDGSFRAVSYGRTPRECQQLGRFLDRVVGGLQSGAIIGPWT